MPVYGLVRDRHGKPKFADINHIPKPMWDLLTLDEQREIQEMRKHGNDDTRNGHQKRAG